MPRLERPSTRLHAGGVGRGDGSRREGSSIRRISRRVFESDTEGPHAWTVATLISPGGRHHGSLASQTVTSLCAAGDGLKIRFAARRRPERSAEPSTSTGGPDSHSHIAQGCRRCPSANHHVGRAPQRQLMQGMTDESRAKKRKRATRSVNHMAIRQLSCGGGGRSGVQTCTPAHGQYRESSFAVEVRELFVVRRHGAGRLSYRRWQRYNRQQG